MSKIEFTVKLSFYEGDFDGKTPQEQAESATAELARMLKHSDIGVEGPDAVTATEEEL